MRFSRVGLVAGFFAAATITGASTLAYAQATVDPGRAEERYLPPEQAPSVGAPLDVPATADQKAPEGAASKRFELSSVTFEGNKTLSDAALQEIAASYVGKEISLAQVFELAGKVTAAYRSEGYILARAIVPTQRIENGAVRIRVIEGFIDKVTIQGDAGGAKSLLEEHGQKIAAIRPLTADVLERELLLAQDISGLKLRSVLTPSQTTPGAADLTLVVEPVPFEGFLGFDNRGSKYLGPWEISGAVYANDVFNTAGRLGLMAVVTPNEGPEAAFGSVTYDQYLNASGLAVHARATHTRTRPGDTLKTIDTKGEATSFKLGLSYPVVRSRDFNLIASGNVTSRDSKSKNALIDPLYDDHIRSADLGVYMNALDTWGGYSTFTSTFTQGFDIFGASDMSDPARSRSNADGTFSSLDFEATHLQPLVGNLSLLLGATGQTSFGESLLSSEQFGLGGLYYGRGYDYSEITGDSGLAGKAELQLDAFDGTTHGAFTGMTLYGFYEGGSVWLSDPLPGENKRESLASAGVGVRLTAKHGITASVELAKPLTRDVAAEQNRDPRLYVALGISF